MYISPANQRIRKATNISPHNRHSTNQYIKKPTNQPPHFLIEPLPEALVGHKAKPEAGDHHVDDLQDIHTPSMELFLDEDVFRISNLKGRQLYWWLHWSLHCCVTIVQYTSLPFTHRKYHHGEPGREKNEVSETWCFKLSLFKTKQYPHRLSSTWKSSPKYRKWLLASW